MRTLNWVVRLKVAGEVPVMEAAADTICSILQRLEAENPTDAAATAARAARLATLRSRAKLSTRLTAALLGFAVLSMAVFRYATALV